MNITDDQQKEQDQIYIFSEHHTHHYITAYKMFLDNKILGVGVKNFRNFCADEKYIESELSCSTHPHNTYIQILAETGLIGILFFLIVLIYFCIHMSKHLMLNIKGQNYFNDFDICILSGIIIYLWPIIPTLNVFNNWMNIAIIINVPFLFWSIKISSIKNMKI